MVIVTGEQFMINSVFGFVEQVDLLLPVINGQMKVNLNYRDAT